MVLLLSFQSVLQISRSSSLYYLQSSIISVVMTKEKIKRYFPILVVVSLEKACLNLMY